MRRWVWGAVALWVSVVVLGAGLAWIAIDRAGQQVSASEPLVPDPAPGSTPGSTPTSTQDPPPTLTESDSPSTGSTQEPAQPGASTSGVPSTPASSAPASSAPASSAAPSQTAPSGAQPAFRTWTGSAGSLTVSCTGQGARLVAATPNDGWQVERSESGDRVRVKFESSESEVEVEAECAASGPVFQVDSKIEGERESESEE